MKSKLFSALALAGVMLGLSACGNQSSSIATTSKVTTSSAAPVVTSAVTTSATSSLTTSATSLVTTSTATSNTTSVTSATSSVTSVITSSATSSLTTSIDDGTVTKSVNFTKDTVTIGSVVNDIFTPLTTSSVEPTTSDVIFNNKTYSKRFKSGGSSDIPTSKCALQISPTGSGKLDFVAESGTAGTPIPLSLIGKDNFSYGSIVINEIANIEFTYPKAQDYFLVAGASFRIYEASANYTVGSDISSEWTKPVKVLSDPNVLIMDDIMPGDYVGNQSFADAAGVSNFEFISSNDTSKPIRVDYSKKTVDGAALYSRLKFQIAGDSTHNALKVKTAGAATIHVWGYSSSGTVTSDLSCYSSASASVVSSIDAIVTSGPVDNSFTIGTAGDYYFYSTVKTTNIFKVVISPIIA